MKGLLGYRADLRAIGITDALQWLDGSFCEDVERIRGRPPGDIDLVTAFFRPRHLAQQELWSPLVLGNLDLFDPDRAKAKYQCHAFGVDFSMAAWPAINRLVYFLQLFTHQKVTDLWKGIVQIPLSSDDDAVHGLVASFDE